ncbi:MAG: serine/threonine-protein kinase Rio1 [Halapricum sp.]
MTGDFELVEPEAAEGVGDEWEEIDVADTEADRIARQRDREFNEFRKRIKNTERFKLEESVFDEATYAAVYKLVQDGYIDAFGGPISTGKEANVYTALAGEEEVAVKVYRINASDFKDMRGYLDGDPRFEGIGQDKRKVVMAWVRKEFANLKRAKKAGVRVPNPIAVERNVLVMEYIATDGDRAKRLSEVDVENPETAYEVVAEYMRRLYDAGLVHGDLSEYNIVFQDGQLVVIDMGQAVTKHHPNADEFLERDCENMAAFFSRQGMEITGEELYEFVARADEQSESAE